MIDWRNVSLLGIDVGFSQTRRSTGIAIYRHGELVTPVCVGSSPQQRSTALQGCGSFDAIAIDGPILPVGAEPALKRRAESLLVGKGFHNRCKPGMSHHHRGLKLRNATLPIANEMVHLAKPASPHFGKHLVRERAPIFEAFPNSFLGVLLEPTDYDAILPNKHESKSDIFFRQVSKNQAFSRLLKSLDWHDDKLLQALNDACSTRGQEAHDCRAALVCLLTAASALSGKATYVGDEFGGWICLPPKALWARWAREALVARKLRLHNRIRIVA